MRVWKMTSVIFILVGSVATVLAGANIAQVTIHAISDDGAPVTGVVIAVSTFAKHVPGDGFGRDESITVDGVTDSGGAVVLSIRCLSGTIAYGPQLPLLGYYWRRGDRIAFTNCVDGKWQPWNPTVELELKKIVSPRELYARKVGDGLSVTVPESGRPVGFDLIKCDWVAPRGTGEVADLVFNLEVKLGGITKNRYQEHDSVLTVGFSHEGDGIQSVYAEPFKGSCLRLPRLAPAEGYESNVVRHAYRHADGGHVERRPDQNYFFRVRTQKNEQGQITNALYGKIHGEIEFDHKGSIRFTYYLNPTPNDRNLEFDPEKNLFTNLTSLEEVSDP